MGAGVALHQCPSREKHVLVFMLTRVAMMTLSLSEYRRPKLEEFLKAALALDEIVALSALAFFLTTNEADKKMASVAVGKRRNDSFKGSETERDEGGTISESFKGLSSPLRNKSFKGMFKKTTSPLRNAGADHAHAGGDAGDAAGATGVTSDDDAFDEAYVITTRNFTAGAPNADGTPPPPGDGGDGSAPVQLSYVSGDVFKIEAVIDDEWYLVQAVADGRQGRVLRDAANPCDDPDGGGSNSVADSIATNPFPRSSNADPPPAHAQEKPKPKPKQMTPVDELIATEVAYLADLISVKDDFFPKLRAVSTAQEASKLFGNWWALIPLAEGMLAALQAQPGNVAEIMTKRLPQFSVPYAKYCNRIPAAQELYSQKLEEQAFRDFEVSNCA